MNKSCWGCYYENKGLCYWFKLSQKSAPKQIPDDVMTKGCSQYSNDVSIGYKAGNELTDKVIKVFNGEIIGEKYKPFRYYTKRKKRKYVKSPHNYAYRKDAQ